MSSDKFRITTTNNQSLRNTNSKFFDMTLSANLTIDESNDISANNDRRSAHNALERQRRTFLNSKYQELAEALPTIKNKRRPSKAMIVTSSLDFVTSALEREAVYKAEIEQLRLENEKLKKQAQLSAEALKQVQPEPAPTKRKNSEHQLSPPLTPKSFRQDSAQRKRIKTDQSPVSLPSPLGPSLSQTSLATIGDQPSFVPSPQSVTHDDMSNLINIYHPQPFFPTESYMLGSLYTTSDDLSYMNTEQCMRQFYGDCNRFQI
ncbi:hypothetical protein BY458DRAFT_495991 [Sporodiniella umbellata]|nr:hypothetical protein BY458DRAFT_495991 [Sporodiniella umbellata]